MQGSQELPQQSSRPGRTGGTGGGSLSGGDMTRQGRSASGTDNAVESPTARGANKAVPPRPRHYPTGGFGRSTSPMICFVP